MHHCSKGSFRESTRALNIRGVGVDIESKALCTNVLVKGADGQEINALTMSEYVVIITDASYFISLCNPTF